MKRITGTHAYGKWSCNPPKGYPRFYSGPFRNQYVHRVIFAQVAGRPPLPGMHIAHMDFNILHFCPENLVECPPEFNPSPERRHPYTGRYMTAIEYTSLLESFY